MKYWKKILSLLTGGLENLVYLVKERHDIVEVRILLIGLGLALLTGLYLTFLLFTDLQLYKVLSYTAIVHAMGGRGLGIATCLSAGIPTMPTILYNFLLEVVIVLICYGFVVLIMRNIIQPKLFKGTVRQAELTAQNQKTRVKKYGTVGLFLFVMFPFFMTGPVVGSIIGYLLNYKTINNFLIVFGGTLSSIIIYSLIGNRILFYINQYIAVDQVKKWGSIVVGILIVIFLIYHIGTVKAFLDKEVDDD